jgi:hypothetical protein
VDKGDRALFWIDFWLEGKSPKQIAPTLLSACLFELQLNEKQLELVGSEKQLELDSC